MWQLENRTRFATERTWTRDRSGAEIWLVAVKCTFDIMPVGATEVASLQPPVVMIPEYIDPDKQAESSLKFDSDLVRTKVATDIVVLGHAYAPQGRPVTELDAGFRVASVVKQVRVTGDRVWQGNTASAPVPFVKMPLVYERAFGGRDPATQQSGSPQWDVRNPVGTGFSTSEAGARGMALPNIEYANQLVRRWSDRPAPASFGPVCAHWQPRAQFAGTYGDAWQQHRMPLLPEDFDDRYYQCSPVDQQAPEFLRGGEAVTLVNLTPSGALRFELPRVYLGLETRFLTGERQHHDKPRLHTVIIEPDVPRVSLVWHSALQCHSRVYKLAKTRIIEKTILRATSEADDLVEENA